MKRLREALRKGGLRRVRSLERDGEARKVAALLVSPELSPDQIGMLHENASRLRRAIRRLSVVEQRVIKLSAAGRSLREIAVTFGHAPCWAERHWDSAAHRLRSELLRRRPAPSGRATRKPFAAAG